MGGHDQGRILPEGCTPNLPLPIDPESDPHQSHPARHWFHSSCERKNSPRLPHP
jgi:hypothetical protein